MSKPTAKTKTEASKRASTRLAQRKFLEAYSVSCNIKLACKEAGIKCRSTVYDWKATDPAFVKQFELATENAVEGLEGEAWRRAKDGVRRPVYQAGKLVGIERVYSDTLMVVLLKAHKKEKYADRREFTGKDGKALYPEVESMTDEQLAAELRDHVSRL